MKIALMQNTPTSQWSEEFQAAGYEGHRWPAYTWRELPEDLVRRMASAGMPLSIAVDSLPESGHVGSDSTPNIESDDQLFSRLRKQYETEQRVLCAWTKKNIYSTERTVEMDAAEYSSTWRPGEVREIPKSLYRLLTANEPEGFTTKPEELAEYLSQNQVKFSRTEDALREQREADRAAKRRAETQAYGQFQTVTIARDKLQKLGKFSDAEMEALFHG